MRCGGSPGAAWPRWCNGCSVRKRPFVALPAHRSDDRGVEVLSCHTAVVRRITEGIDGAGSTPDPVGPTIGGAKDRRGGVEATDNTARQRPKVDCVTVRKNCTVGEENPVAPAVRSAHRRSDWNEPPSRCSVLGGIAEVANDASSGHNPVAVAAGVGHHGHRRSHTIRVETGTRSGKACITECEDAAVGGNHVVATAITGRHDRYYRCVQLMHLARRPCGCDSKSWDRPVESCITECEDAAIGGYQPVAAMISSWRNAHNGTLEVEGTHRAKELGRAKREDSAVATHKPVSMLWSQWKAPLAGSRR